MKRYRCAFAGIVLAVKTSRSLRIQLAAAVHVLLFGFWQGLSAADWAAKGVDFLEPRKPRPPALAQERALPWVSVMVTMVLLKVDWI